MRKAGWVVFVVLLGTITTLILYFNNSRETASRTPQAPIQSSEENPAPTALVSEAKALFEGDRALYQSIYDTIQLLGTSPIEETQGTALLDSPLSRAILLAMLTANPVSH